MSWDLLQNGLVVTLNVFAMLAAGLTVTVGALGASLRPAGPIVLGAAVNLLVMPALVWLMIAAAGLSPTLALGFLLCAAAPGGNTGPLLTQNAKGDVPYAVALVVVLSFASILSVPLVLGLAHARAGGELPVAAMVRLILLFQIAPLCLGMAVRALHERVALHLAQPARIVANLSLAGVTVLLLVRHGHLMLANGAVVGWMALFVVAGLAAGRLLGPLRLPRARALSMVTATRNLSLALLLGAQVFRDPATLLAILSYGLLWIVGATAASVWLRRLPA